VLIGRRERGLAVEALRAVRFRQLRVDTHTPIEHETFAQVMLIAALFEILENSAIELVHVLKTLTLHVRRGLFATNAARAERYNRPLL
jgi:hypothetical protein